MPTNPTPRDTTRVLREVERRLAALERGRIGSIALGATESLQGGATTAQTPDGESLHPVFRFGPLDTGDVGIEIRRADGTLALRVGAGAIGGTEQFVSLHDSAGTAVVTDAAGGGLARPSVPMPMLPVDGGDSRAVATTVTNGTWITLFQAVGRKVNGVYECRFWAVCGDVTTGGEARLVNEALQPLTNATGGPQAIESIPVGTTETTAFVTAPCLHDANAGEEMMIKLQVRRTAGAAAITVRPGVICGAV